MPKEKKKRKVTRERRELFVVTVHDPRSIQDRRQVGGDVLFEDYAHGHGDPIPIPLFLDGQRVIFRKRDEPGTYYEVEMTQQGVLLRGSGNVVSRLRIYPKDAGSILIDQE